MKNKCLAGFFLTVLFSLSALGQRPVYIEEQVEKLAFGIRREGRLSDFCAKSSASPRLSPILYFER
jgi:hypothetical protein